MTAPPAGTGIGATASVESPGGVVQWGVGVAGGREVPLEAQSGIVAISGGGYFSLALTVQGRVIAWGDNWKGQTTVPQEALTGVDAIAAGSLHALALKDGRVLAWGDNASGQTTVPPEAQSGVSAIAAGGSNSMALKDGGVIVWGQRGDVEVPAEARQGVKAIATTSEMFAAITNDGRLIMWGPVIRQGTLGDPRAQEQLPPLKAVALGNMHALVLTEDGSVIAPFYSPNGGSDVPDTALSGVVAIAAGGYFSLALKSDGSVIAWGEDAYGETDVPVEANADVTAIAAGGFHALALKVVPAISKPGKVSGLMASVRKGAIDVTWRPPRNLGGAKKVSYEYRIVGQAWTATDKRSVRVTGKAGKPLVIDVRAVNSAGPGPSARITGRPL